MSQPDNFNMYHIYFFAWGIPAPTFIAHFRKAGPSLLRGLSHQTFSLEFIGQNGERKEEGGRKEGEDNVGLFSSRLDGRVAEREENIFGWM